MKITEFKIEEGIIHVLDVNCDEPILNESYLNLSNEDIANCAKINVVTFNRKMNGITNWKLSECISIALFLGKTVEEIFLPHKLHKSIEK